MTSSEYLASLRFHLQNGGMPEDEINKVMIEYDNKFRHSAGLDELVAERLGSPETVAQRILAQRSRGNYRSFDPLGAAGSDMAQDTFSEGEEKEFDPFGGEGVVFDYQPHSSGQDNNSKKTLIISLIVIGVLLLPALLPLFIFLMALLLSLLIIAVVLDIATLIVGAVALFVGAKLLFSIMPLALCFLGAGLFLFGVLGALCLPLTRAVGGIYKRMFGGLGKLFHKIFV